MCGRSVGRAYSSIGWRDLINPLNQPAEVVPIADPEDGFEERCGPIQRGYFTHEIAGFALDNIADDPEPEISSTGMLGGRAIGNSHGWLSQA